MLLSSGSPKAILPTASFGVLIVIPELPDLLITKSSALALKEVGLVVPIPICPVLSTLTLSVPSVIIFT